MAVTRWSSIARRDTSGRGCARVIRVDGDAGIPFGKATSVAAIGRTQPASDERTRPWRLQWEKVSRVLKERGVKLISADSMKCGAI
jgi:hypothetical protein